MNKEQLQKLLDRGLWKAHTEHDNAMPDAKRKVEKDLRKRTKPRDVERE